MFGFYGCYFLKVGANFEVLSGHASLVVDIIVLTFVGTWFLEIRSKTEFQNYTILNRISKSMTKIFETLNQATLVIREEQIIFKNKRFEQ